MSNRKHKGFILRFEHTCSTSPPSTHEGFPLCLIPMDHSSVPQHLQALGHSSPVHTASPPARRGRTSNNKFAPELETMRTHTSASSRNKKRSLGDLNTLITNKNSHNKTLLVDIAMDSSSVCVRKLGWEWWRKTQEISFNTLDKNSPFDWKY